MVSAGGPKLVITAGTDGASNSNGLSLAILEKSDSDVDRDCDNSGGSDDENGSEMDDSANNSTSLSTNESMMIN